MKPCHITVIAQVFLAITSIRAAEFLEPTDATEAAAKVKEHAEQEAVDAKYASWKASLSAERQQWENHLEKNLGDLYFSWHKKARANKPDQPSAWDYVEDDPKLPRVLIIGDTISRAYTVPVRKALKGKANVHRAPANCGPTASGLKHLDVWLGDGKWDLIHFNFGIHDRKTGLDDYQKRLGEIVLRLKATGAKLVWATTTPIHEDPAKGYIPTSIDERNAAATLIMKQHGVAINDLHAFILPHVATDRIPNDVHFQQPGNEHLGAEVARIIEKNLQSP
jgi:hypothetical protein